MSKSYRLNLPQTAFQQKLNTAARETELQQFWNELRVYEKNLAQRASGERFLLHDGPPYLSSPKIHIGTALNKVLKDFVTKYKAQRGFYAPFVPGYDSHGLPIENAALKEVKGGRSAITPVELRQRCREHALTNLKGQEGQFQRLGVWGDWNNPYVTLDKTYEAAQLRVFARMVERGYLYRGLKPVHWCPNCETALADAEVEMPSYTCDAVHVAFEVKADSLAKLPEFARDKSVSFVIWTTTPWSLPANVALAVNADLDYDFVETKTFGVVVVAQALRDAFLCDVGLTGSPVLGSAKGLDLEHVETTHPWYERKSPVVLSAHVLPTMGTGVVHIAPGLGAEDFAVGRAYNLEVLCPLDGRGVLTAEAAPFNGLRFDKANEPIVALLRENGKLVHSARYTHEYPHCWRCKKPLLERATDQWFVSVESLRQQALDAVDTVEWLPASGRTRIREFVSRRGDWCVSRQRVWGVPIPVFNCTACGEHRLTRESVERVADVFEREGSDSWWNHDAVHFLSEGSSCAKCNGKDFSKGTDTLDVWFDSGVSWHTVVDQREELRGSPAEMYLEGSDQHRGWFQSSLLTSVAAFGRAPYKTVNTHGFVVDDKRKKMAKSEGNVVDPDDVIKEFGADVLRLWVASVNYADDTPIGKEQLKQLAKVYDKLRNTVRFLLGNLNDFDPAQDRVPLEELSKLDAFVLHRLHQLVEQVQQDFDRYEFQKFYQLLQNFCVVDLSSFYFDMVKDRLYTQASKSHSRRCAQTVLEHVLQVLVRLMVPVTPHLAEDVWQHMPAALKQAGANEESVLLTSFPSDTERFRNDALESLFTQVMTVRSVCNKALEHARSEKKVGKPQEAKALLSFQDQKLAAAVRAFGDELTDLLMTSGVTVMEAALPETGETLATLSESGVNVQLLAAEGTKCPRCRGFKKDVGAHEKFPELCAPCADVEEAGSAAD